MDEPMTYVARCPCGGAVMMSVNSPDRRKEVARDVRRVLMAGYTVDRMTVEAARQQTFCKNRGKCQAQGATA